MRSQESDRLGTHLHDLPRLRGADQDGAAACRHNRLTVRDNLQLTSGVHAVQLEKAAAERTAGHTRGRELGEERAPTNHDLGRVWHGDDDLVQTVSRLDGNAIVWGELG